MNTEANDQVLSPGQRLTSRYRIAALLGQSRRGVVYSAYDRSSRGPVALRVFDRQNASDLPGFAPLFLEECKRRFALSHPHAFEVLGFGQTRTGRFFVASQLWRGTPLSRALTARGPLDPQLASEIVSRVCGALAQLHALGLVHGRVSPQLVFLTGRGVSGVKLGGVAEAELCGARPQKEPAPAASCFAAPERIAGQPLTVQTDVYGAGLLLFALLTGRAPQYEPGLSRLLRCQREDPFPPAFRTMLWRSAPFLVPVLERCLAAEPSHRFASIACVRDALQRQRLYIAA